VDTQWTAAGTLIFKTHVDLRLQRRTTVNPIRGVKHMPIIFPQFHDWRLLFTTPSTLGRVEGERLGFCGAMGKSRCWKEAGIWFPSSCCRGWGWGVGCPKKEGSVVGLTEAQFVKLAALFNELDTNHSGHLDREKLAPLLPPGPRRQILWTDVWVGGWVGVWVGGWVHAWVGVCVEGEGGIFDHATFLGISCWISWIINFVGLLYPSHPS